MTNGSASNDHSRANARQRARRARHPRIDYYPNSEALAVIDSKRPKGDRWHVADTNSAILDAIVIAWGRTAGILPKETPKPASAAQPSDNWGKRDAELATRFARARVQSNKSDGMPGTGRQLRAGANKSGKRSLGPMQRVPCGGRRRRDGKPCEALSVPGKRRCKWHGGCSTGPKTAEGKTRALANLWQNRKLGFRILAQNPTEQRPKC